MTRQSYYGVDREVVSQLQSRLIWTELDLWSLLLLFLSREGWLTYGESSHTFQDYFQSQEQPPTLYFHENFVGFDLCKERWRHLPPVQICEPPHSISENRQQICLKYFKEIQSKNKHFFFVELCRNSGNTDGIKYKYKPKTICALSLYHYYSQITFCMSRSHQ